MNDFYPSIAILLFPILGFIAQAFLGKSLVRSLGVRGAGFIAALPILLAFAVSALLTYRLIGLPEDQRSVVETFATWIDTVNLTAPLELLIDPLSMTMALIITGVGSLIHIYAATYMAEDRDFSRFFTYMNLFIAAMLLLVLGNNLVLLFVGWEGVGLCSYLLIGFWYKDLPNARAANKAFIVNRIGDWGLMLGLFLIIALLAKHGGLEGGRTLSYDILSSKLITIFKEDATLSTAVALLLFVGAAGKSAQFPLYLWLPDAMAGPTPVSALIHAATMVTSGVFLLNRMHYVFEASPLASAIICMIGAFTAAFAAIIAFGQTDIKRVLAYSTVSQLGFMFIACGAGAYWAGMFHVTTHAFFKALLFLGAGAVIYAMQHNQDMRNYGGLYKYMKITAICMMVGWLAISGVPLLSGYFSKEAILGSALGGWEGTTGGIKWPQVAGWIGLGVAFLTAVYMTRLTSLTFFGKEERWRSIPAHAHAHGHEEHASTEVAAELGEDRFGFYRSEPLVEEPEHHHDLDAEHTPKEVPVTMWMPLVILAALSAFAGAFLSDKFEHWLYPTGLPFLGEVPHEPFGIPLVPLSIAAAVGGVAVGLFFYLRGLPKDQGWTESAWKPWRRGAREQFGFDYLATAGAVEGGGDVARTLYSQVDVNVIDRMVNGIGGLAAGFGNALRSIQTGYVRLYALVMLVGLVAFISYFAIVVNTIGGSR